jgi:hypothetical protein
MVVRSRAKRPGLRAILLAFALAPTLLAASLLAIPNVGAAVIPRQPDGRIRKGSGTLIGNNIYNSTAVGQTKSALVAPGHGVTFHISIQNDTNIHDAYSVKLPPGGPGPYFTIQWLHGTTDITAAINSGGYATPQIAAGSAYGLTAKVKVSAMAPAETKVVMLVSIASVGDSTKVDAVKFVVTAS